ncbi:recombinase family protein [Saccharopolyspora hattusasensis]|uniref:recombinase family protein n=1 Tax=Saccharopolyspora hattusasensis TaxID=1128679 RepID=UPI003D971BCA
MAGSEGDRRLRAVIYVRISKDKVGAGLGVERQEKDCRALAERLGWLVVAVFVDNDMSAYSGKPRKDYSRMLAFLRAGRADAVLAWHTDRLHRSPTELEEYITVCQDRDVPTQCVRAGTLDLSTANGRMQARIAGAVARQEVEHMSERIRDEKAHAAAGKWLGSPRPFGFRFLFDVPEPPHKVTGVELEPAEADAVRDGVARVLAGESCYAVTKLWEGSLPTVRGGKWTQQNVKRTLCRALNAGLVEHKGEIVGTSDWPTIITEEELYRVRELLSDPKRTTYSGVRSLKWVGSGLYRCGVCGWDLRSASVTNRDGSARRMYRCRSTRHVNINGEPMDAYVTEAVCRLLDAEGRGCCPTPTGRP